MYKGALHELEHFSESIKKLRLLYEREGIIDEYMLNMILDGAIKIASDHLREDPEYYTKLGTGLTDTLYMKLANAYRARSCKGKARKLLKGEYHPLCANYEGPGTRIDIDKVRNYPPYNEIDACAREHDLAYEKAFQYKGKIRENMIREADEKFLSCIKKFKKEEPYYSIGKIGITGKMKGEKYLPWLMKKLISDYKGGFIMKPPESGKPQSIIFKKDKWTQKAAEQWLEAHGYGVYKIDVSNEYYRFRQYKPIKAFRYRTITFGDGIKAIIGYGM